MHSVNPKILAKIKKCLALASSCNSNEAATALRQAQALLEKHGLDITDVELSAVSERQAKAGAIKTPAEWERELASTVAEAFQCELLFGSGYWCFIGIHAAPEVAQYSFTVLYRQIFKARQEFLLSCRRLKRSTKTRRADIFCAAWVNEVHHTIIKFGGRKDSRIGDWIQKNYPQLNDLKTNDRTDVVNYRQGDYVAAMKGRDAAGDVQLHHAMSSTRANPVALEVF